MKPPAGAGEYAAEKARFYAPHYASSTEPSIDYFTLQFSDHYRLLSYTPFQQMVLNQINVQETKVIRVRSNSLTRAIAQTWVVQLPIFTVVYTYEVTTACPPDPNTLEIELYLKLSNNPITIGP
jgi:hypothetical protein